MATVAQIYMQKVGRAAQEITYCACKLLKSNQWTQSTKVMKSAELRPFLFSGLGTRLGADERKRAVRLGLKSRG